MRFISEIILIFLHVGSYLCNKKESWGTRKYFYFLNSKFLKHYKPIYYLKIIRDALSFFFFGLNLTRTTQIISISNLDRTNPKEKSLFCKFLKTYHFSWLLKNSTTTLTTTNMLLMMLRKKGTNCLTALRFMMVVRGL